VSSVADVDGMVGDGAGYTGSYVVDKVFGWDEGAIEAFADTKLCRP